MSLRNPGDILEWGADEDIDPDVEIAEEALRRLTPNKLGRNARQILEDMKEERE